MVSNVAQKLLYPITECYIMTLSTTRFILVYLCLFGLNKYKLYYLVGLIGGKYMRTLKEIRESRRKQLGTDLALIGMGEKPTEMTKEAIQEQRDLFEHVVKPMRDRAYKKLMVSGHL